MALRGAQISRWQTCLDRGRLAERGSVTVTGLAAGGIVTVPKIIHQTWKTQEIPELHADWVHSVRALNPSFEYRLWTDEDNRSLVEQRYPWFLERYDAYRHNIERADAIRYFILYTFGGVYIDLDMECLRPIEPLITGPGVFFSLEAGPTIFHTVVSNAFMAAPRHHGFFFQVMRHLEQAELNDITFTDVFNSTGPNMLAEQCRRHWDRYDFNVLGLDKICPRAVLRQNPTTGSLEIDEIRSRKLLFFIHHNTESWNTQMPCPKEEIEGYVLFDNHDIQGFDIDHVAFKGDSVVEIAATCSRNPEAIGFNYNGYIKGRGGRLKPCSADGSWFKDGIEPWICIKKECVDSVSE